VLVVVVVVLGMLVVVGASVEVTAEPVVLGVLVVLGAFVDRVVVVLGVGVGLGVPVSSTLLQLFVVHSVHLNCVT
jgi:hypothetical protein